MSCSAKSGVRPGADRRLLGRGKVFVEASIKGPWEGSPEVSYSPPPSLWEIAFPPRGKGRWALTWTEQWIHTDGVTHVPLSYCLPPGDTVV